MDNKYSIAVIGLGYVGLPLSVAFSEYYSVVGFDTSEERIVALSSSQDIHCQIPSEILTARCANYLSFTTDIEMIKDCNVYIVTVPTPIDKYNKPDLSYLLSASQTVGAVLSKGDIVIYESTVYPGCTEEDCVPVLEQTSGLLYNIDFYCGYSPERINPGEATRDVKSIVKITSGSTPKVALEIDLLYRKIIIAGTYPAPSMRVAEAAKVIENTQRDVNISFINELSLIFDRMEIDTMEVLEAAASKWNFMPFRPGLVGGHCIGVDPFYLTYKAESLGYKPQVIHSGRSINDNMGVYIANKVVKLMVRHNLKVNGSKVLVLGITFKENCADTRNSRVVDIVRELESFGIEVVVYDPHANESEVSQQYDINLVETLENTYDAIIVSVGHDLFKNLDYASLKRNDKSVIYDVKSILPRKIVTDRL